jgi:cell division protein FtsQ
MRRLNPFARRADPKPGGRTAPDTKTARTAKPKPAPSERERRHRQERLRRQRRIALRYGLPVVLAGGLAGAAAWVWTSGLAGRSYDAAVARLQAETAELGLAVQDVLVTGRVRTEPGRILKALAVERDDPILAFDPAGARRRLQALPWIRNATVERRLPDEIFLTLEERKPLALWQLDGRVRVIDDTGKPLNGVDPRRYADLPLVVGPGANGEARALLRAIDSEPDLAGRVAAAIRVSERRWTVNMDNGVRVQLPAENPAAAWSHLARIEQRQGLLQRDVRTIDLRQPDRMVVRMGEEAEPMAPPPAESALPGEST